ncbi:restriction endonuclease subunit S [Latilactobacillus curvatus]|uniref:restriction endonuclease subunit S n=1 Tax=Latilactobacillus curvatus TaxID=28038 RepID=UPI0023DC7AC0|nr:restriction endonuclease subunit S [Latilactobacillus curvatus]
MSNKVPQIRFNGYSDAWEERKLSDIVSRLSKSSNNSELPRVEFEDIVSGEGRLNKDVSHKFDDRKGILFSSQNILYGKLRPYLKNWLLADFNGIALGDFWVFKSINSDPKFVYSLIQSNHYQKVANDTSGTKMPRSDWKKVSSTEFQIPSSLEEQKKIGSLFKQLDNTIALHQRKLDLLKEQKKGYLQKMFPKNGAKVPELRFAGFADDWEERKLGEVFNQTVEYINPNEANLELWSVTVERGLTPKTARYNREALVKKNDKFKVVHDGDIVYNPMNLTIGAVGFNKSEKSVAVSGYYVTMNMNSGFNNSYFQTWLKSENAIKQYKLYATGSLIEKQRVQFPTLSLIKSYIPTFEEQQKIGSFFKQLDNSIALHQRKLDLLKEQKKGFLQKMFV